jgi:hypothetical protein
MTAPPSRPLAHVWGGVWTGTSDARVRQLEGALAGVLVVDRERASSAVPGAAVDGTPWTAVAAVIRRLPATATAFAWLGDAIPSAAALRAMCDLLPGHDAVVVASPVSDAVKRVAGGMVVAGVDRAGLCRPGPPLVVRAAAARDRVVPALAAGHDVVAALATSGCAVTVMEPAELDDA